MAYKVRKREKWQKDIQTTDHTLKIDRPQMLTPRGVIGETQIHCITSDNPLSNCNPFVYPCLYSGIY
jgi:hypothetical protein